MLSAGSAFDISITLEVAGIDTAVTVVADSQVLETARSQIAGTVPQTEVQNLPMNGRNFLDLALLVPGVSPTNTNSTQLFAETSAVPGQGLSIASQRNLSNSFIVDGVSANDDAAGLSGITFGVDAVEQFQVVTGGGQAELGRALGGYVNVVTKSGTNALHGSLYGFFRNDAFNGENALTGQTLPMDQEQFGFSLGGPVRKGRTFYFTNVERKVLDQTGVVAITPENVAIINAKLNQVAYPGMPVTTGIYPNPVHSSNVLGKIDHQFSGADQLSVRYALYDVISDNARGVGNLNAPSASSGLDNIDQSIAISNVWTISSNTVNETRVQISHGDLKAYSTDQIGPQVAISGVANFGTLSSSPWRRENTLFQAVSNVSHSAGAHALRAGIDFLFNDDTITFPRTFRGSYTFSSLGNFLTGNYSGFAQTFGDPAINQKNPNVGVYAQDEWRVGSRLTLNGGVRYDLQFLDTVNTDTNNVSPRAGFVWAPTASATFLIRGGAGIFFDRVPLRAVANALLSAGNTTDPAQLHQPQVSGILPTQAGAPVFPNILPDRLPSTALVSFTTMDKDLQNAYSKQANIEVERTLGGSRTISVGYQYFRGENLLMSINQNVPTCVAAGTNNGCRPVSTYMNNSQYRGAGDSNYHGLHVTYLQRPKNWSAVRVSYALSKSMNDLGEAFFSSPTDPTNVMKDWGRSDNDQRHRLVISASVNSPMTPGTTMWEHISHGFQASTMLQYLLVASLQHRVRHQQPAGHGRTAIRGWIGVDTELRRPPGRVHSAECRHGQRLLYVEPASQPFVPARRRQPHRGLGRSVQSDRSGEPDHAQHHLRPGLVSVESGAVVQHGDGGRRSENHSIRRAIHLLTRVRRGCEDAFHVVDGRCLASGSSREPGRHPRKTAPRSASRPRERDTVSMASHRARRTSERSHQTSRPL